MIHLEFARLWRPGFIDSLGVGRGISAPAVYHFAQNELAKMVDPLLLNGEKESALSIGGPFAGNDMPACCTTTTEATDGKHHAVNVIMM